jgi:hypothetical protein
MQGSKPSLDPPPSLGLAKADQDAGGFAMLHHDKRISISNARDHSPNPLADFAHAQCLELAPERHDSSS